MDRSHIVSVVKVEQSIEDAVKEALRLAGGMDSVVAPGETVYLKPNFVAPRESSKGVTTDLEIIRVVADEVRRCGGAPVLFETPATEFDREIVFNVLGIRDFARKNRIRVAEGDPDLVKVSVPGGRVLKSIRIPRILHGAKIINLPKLKTHVSARMTCGMKNLIGLLPDAEKRRVHVRGVHGAVSDLGRVFQPALTVVDAVTCMHGDGPTYGDPIAVGLILAGKDMLSVDKIGSRIIGLPWREIPYLRLSQAGKDGAAIEVAGEGLNGITARFTIPQKSLFYHTSTRLIHILDVAFSRIFPVHLNAYLFHTGYLGTNPEIIEEACDQCGECVDVCPVPEALEIQAYQVNYKRCIRCLKCYEGCRKHAIAVKGFSRPEAR